MKIKTISLFTKNNWRSAFLSTGKALTLIMLLCSFSFLLISTLGFINTITTTITPSYSTCTTNTSKNQAIKISAHREKSIFGRGSKVFIFWVSTDNKKSWKEFMKFFPDDPPRIPICKNIKSLDDKNYWVWEGWQLAITHDGSNSWLIWEMKDTYPNQKFFAFDAIHNVQFDNANNGSMLVDLEGSGEFLTTLQTVDGGKTWK